MSSTSVGGRMNAASISRPVRSSRLRAVQAVLVCISTPGCARRNACMMAGGLRSAAERV